jgi:K+-sensing histidine kinase KdpD
MRATQLHFVSHTQIYVGNLMRKMKSKAKAIADHPVVELLVIGVLLALAIVAARLLADTGVRVPYLALLPVVVLSCDFYGFRAALWTTVVGGIAAWYFFVEPFMTFVLPDLGDAIQLASFIGVSLFVSWALDTYRTAILILEKSLEEAGSEAAGSGGSIPKIDAGIDHPLTEMPARKGIERATILDGSS